MTDEILTLRVEDQSSAAAEAATAALDKYGASAEVTETKLSRLSRTSAQLVNRYDDLTKAENRLARAEAELAAAQEAFAHDTDGLKIKSDQAQRALEAMAAKVAGLRRAYEELKATTAGGTGAADGGQTQEIEKVSAALAAYGTNIARAREAVRALKDEVYPVSAAYREHWTELQRLQALEQAEEITEIELTSLTAKRTAALKAKIAELDGSAAAERRAAEAAKVAARAEAELNDQARAFIAVADPAAAAAARHNEQVALADRLLASGKITAAQYTAGIRLSREETERVAVATTGASGALRSLGVQSIDVVQQLASGAPVLQTLVQQGGQVAQVAATSGGGLKAWGEAGSTAFRAIVSPAGLAVAAIGATAAAVGYLAVTTENADQRLRTLTATLRATRTDAEAVAPLTLAAARGAVLNGAGISLDDARTAATAFAAQPSFTGSQGQLEALVRTANDLAVRLGLTLPDAAAKLAAGMKDPAALAAELKDKLVGFDDEMVRSVALQAQAGDRAAAFATQMRAIRTETKGAAEAIQTDLGKAWDGFKKEFVAATDDKSTIGGALLSAMEWYVTYLTQLVRVTRGAADAIKSLIPGGAPTPDAVAPVPGSQLGRTVDFAVAPETRLPDAVRNRIYDIAAAGNYGGTPEVSGLQYDLATRIAWQESRGNQAAVSPAGARGLFQIMPATAAGLGVNASDLDDNIRGGLKYIAELWAKYKGNPALVAAAFNWGPGNLDKFLKSNRDISSVPAETQNYVRNVTGVDVPRAISATYHGPTLAPATDAAAIGVADSATATVNRAIADANAAGVSGRSREQALADVAKYTEALAILSRQGETSGTNVDKLREALAAAGKAASDAIPPAARLTREAEDQTRAHEALTAAYQAGSEAVAQATIHLKAEGAAQGIAGRQTVEYLAARVALTEAYRKEAEAASNLALARKTAENGDQVSLIQAEAAALNLSAEARAGHLAGVRAEMDAKRDSSAASAEFVQGYKDSAAAVANATAALDRNKSALAEVDTFATSVGSNVANAISQAFVSGSANAVTFRNTALAVFAQVANEGAKLALLNPILNATVGGNHRTTLSDVFSVVTSGPTAAGSGSSGLMDNASNALTVGSLGDKLGLTNFGGQISSLTDSLGLTGSDGLFSGVSNWLGTPLPFTDVAGATNAALAFLPNGMAGPATLPQFTAAGGATVGQFIGGVGAGYGLGSLAGGFIQNSMGRVGPAPQIGAGGGALAGAAIGSFVPVIGTMIGAIIGGLIGGAGGGLIGPKAASPFTSTGLGVDASGMLSVGQTVAQIADPTQEVAALRSDVATLNALLSTSGAKITATGGITQIGQNSPKGDADPSKAASLAATIPALRFTSDDPMKAAALADKSFASVDELAKALADVTAAAAATTDLLDKTVPALVAASKTNSTFADQVKAVTDTYTAAIDQAKALAVQAGQPTETVDKLNTAQADLATARDNAVIRSIDSALESLLPDTGGALSAQISAIAKQYGEAIEAVRGALANDNSAAVTERLTKAEADLADARDRGTEAANKAATEATRGTERALLLRLLTADATVNGSPARINGAKEMALGEQQRLESLAFDANLVATYGEAYRQTEDYAQRVYALDQAHYAERLALQKQFTDQSVANDRALTAQIYSLQSRQATADAAVSDDPARVQAAALQAFDERARLEKESTASGLVATYGEAIRQTQLFADVMGQTDRTLYAERLAIQKQYADQSAAQEKAAADKAAGLISNLADFAVQLQTGPQSALSAQDQYAVARSAFETTRDKARAGDADALAGVQGAVTTLLTASRALNGSGAAYAADFTEALSAVQDFGQMAPETLTAAVFTSETRSAAERVVDALAELRAVPIAATGSTAAGLAGVRVAANDNSAGLPAAVDSLSASVAALADLVDRAAVRVAAVPEPTATAAPDPITVRLDAGDLLTRAGLAAELRMATLAIVNALRDVQDEIKRGNQDQRARALLPMRATG